MVEAHDEHGDSGACVVQHHQEYNVRGLLQSDDGQSQSEGELGDLDHEQCLQHYQYQNAPEQQQCQLNENALWVTEQRSPRYMLIVTPEE